jgi:hypothetical protein
MTDGLETGDALLTSKPASIGVGSADRYDLGAGEGAPEL